MKQKSKHLNLVREKLLHFLFFLLLENLNILRVFVFVELILISKERREEKLLLGIKSRKFE